MLPNIEPRNGSLEAFLVAGILYGILIIGLPWITDFFKQNYNYVSFFIFGSILSIGYFYLMNNFLFGILDINELQGGQTLFGLDFLQGISWNIGETIVWSGIISILLQLINEILLDRA